MATVSELLNDLAVKAGVDVTGQDFKALLSSSGLMVPVPESVVAQLNKGLYTKDAAINDPDIYNSIDRKAKGKYFGILDNKVSQLLASFNDFFTDDQKAEIKALEDTPSKYELINKYLPAAVAEKSKTKEGKKDAEVDIRKIEEDYNAKIQALETDWKGKLATKEKEYKDKIITKDLTQKILSFNLLDNLPGGKEYLANAKISEIQNEYLLVENENGGVDLRRKDDPEKEVYINNVKQTIDSVLNDKLKDWVKKSDVKPSTPSTQSPFPVSQKPAASMTLQEQNKVRIEKQIEDQREKLKKVS